MSGVACSSHRFSKQHGRRGINPTDHVILEGIQKMRTIQAYETRLRSCNTSLTVVRPA